MADYRAQARTRVAKDEGSRAEQAKVVALLGTLRSWEDPANEEGAVYREMRAAADAVRMAKR